MTDFEKLYQERLARYTTTLRNEKADCVPIRPFAAEVTAVYAGMTCQDVAQDYRKAFEAIIKCCRDFDWDATPPSMVAAWMGLVQAARINYFAMPGVQLPPTTTFQYVEPPEDAAFMREEEYPHFIADPTGFLATVLHPRTTHTIVPPGEPNTFENNITLLAGMSAMREYFLAFGPHCERMRRETGTPCAIAGILKAPFDIIADKLRGYVGLCRDMYTRPSDVLAACDAVMPHLLYIAKATSDPAKQLPVGLWMHRGCVPFLSPAQFETFFWPSLKKIICALWEEGIQTLFYAEGEWNPNLKYIKELPDKSIVYHIDRGDIEDVHREVGKKFCISGGIPNDLLAFGTTDEVKAHVKKVIAKVGRDGGYIVDASAIMQDDTKIDNLRAMCDAAREFGKY